MDSMEFQGLQPVRVAECGALEGFGTRSAFVGACGLTNSRIFGNCLELRTENALSTAGHCVSKETGHVLANMSE